MQGKGLIKLVLVVLLTVCLFQFFYFIPTGRVEREAESFAETTTKGLSGETKDLAYKIARSNYLDSMSSEEVFSVPGIASYTYSDLKGTQLALGLDLKGGMSTVLEVDLQDLIVALAGRNSKDVDFLAALKNAKKTQETEQENFVSLFVREFKRVAPTRNLASIFQQSETLEGVNLNTTDAEIERMLRQKADQTVDLTYKMLKERIDRLGVVQPNVTLDANRDLILVEMPGIDNPQRARQYLQASAELGFWETYRFSDAGILQGLQAADARLKTIGDTTAVRDTGINAQLGPLLKMLTLNQAGELGQNVVGIADKNKKNNVSELLAKPEIANLFPRTVKFLWGYKGQQNFQTKEPTGKYELYAIRMSPNNDKAPLDGEVVTNAAQVLDQTTGEPTVTLAMNAKGSKQWAELTGKAFNGDAAGAKREVAIVLDNEVVTTPSVNTGAITGGNTEISGSFNVQEAKDLANILEVGKLPAKTRIIQESTVGPSLGKQNIQKSTTSLIVAFLLVMAFMVFYYAKAGVISVISLLINIILIFGILSSIGTVLTLPGIAGIVLTIGMAVDANVIIFERIREELRDGKSLLDSVSEGFKQSYSSIIDANVTTLLTAFVLAYFGLGPIKGFAVVLITGVLSSMFTAVVVGKLFMDGYIDGGKRGMTFWTAPTKDAMSSLNFDWIGNRKIAYIFSGILVALSLISIFTRGFDKGVDFTGGHSYNVKFAKEITIDAEKIRTGLEPIFGSAPVVKAVDAANTLNITTAYNINKNSTEADDETRKKLFEGINTIIGGKANYETFINSSASDENTHIVSYTKVGPTIADDITRSSIWAGIFALLLIFLYILIRFSKWQYSLGAIIALAHDTIITLGMFSLLKGLLPFSLEIDQAFIAAILTVIGYSINDTVIVYDRIREYFSLDNNTDADTVINKALNTTLSRTTITSFTTFFVVFILLLFGGSSIKGFAFAISFGIFIGTYSSIFIAAPLVRDLSNDLIITKSRKVASVAK